MKTSTLSAAAMIAVAGLTCGVANAQVLINVSGATLFENFFSAPASTIDYFDADANGNSRLTNNTVQQLAPTFSAPSYPNPWLLNYRGVGSGNGVTELFTWGLSFNTTTGQSGALGQTSATLSSAYINRSKYFDSVLGLTGVFNSGNPGASPVTSILVAPFTATAYTNNPTNSGGGVRIDAAVIDVPTAWFVRISGTSGENLTPGDAGYGTFAGVGKSKAGVNNAQTNTLRSLTQGANTFNLFTTPAAANANTVFDTQVASATIAVLVNHGVGETETTYSELRHLNTTGRSNNGENLVFVTRDAGSGTRNAFCNSIGQDPSWGVGENIGVRSTTASFDLLGLDFIPSYKGGSGSLERTVGFHRLAIGYAGTERGINVGSYLSSGRVEVLAVKADTIGGTIARRPFIDYVLDNNANGYNIAGPETFSTIGDPRNALELGGDAGNTNPRMRNPAAAAYLNNITRSITAFVGAPGGLPTEFTPGEFLSSRFTLVAATDNIADPTNPINLIPNPVFNQALQDYTRVNSENALGNWLTYGFVSLNGRVPTRLTGTVYSDAVPNGANYIDMSGNALTYGTNFADSRNRVSGDFNGDAARNADDITFAVRAFRHRNPGTSGFTWAPPAGNVTLGGAPGSSLSIEIVGDFNGDGTFDRHDLRYMADGLAIATLSTNSSPSNVGNLDRAAGFEAVDAEWLALGVSNNFFGTTLKTGKPYAAGDSRGDVANSTGLQAAGWAPIGAEGPSNGTNTVPALDRNVVDAFDIDYVYRQFKQNARVTDGALNWSNLAESVGGDLSADINGDLVVDQADITELVTCILGTRLGDVNLNGVANAADIAIAQGFINTPGGWARGDVDGNGTVNQADIDLISANLSPCNPADICGVGATYDAGVVDIGPDAALTIEDFLNFLAAFGDGTGCPGAVPCLGGCNPADICGVGATYDNGTVDIGPDGQLTIEDFLNFLAAFGDATGCP